MILTFIVSDPDTVLKVNPFSDDVRMTLNAPIIGKFAQPQLIKVILWCFRGEVPTGQDIGVCTVMLEVLGMDTRIEGWTMVGEGVTSQQATGS